MTHVNTPQDLLPSLGRIDNVLTQACGYVEAFDFSKANSSYEARVAAVTKVASVCYANPKALNSISLFNRLEAESHGLPSSSYEFVPVLLSRNSYEFIADSKYPEDLDTSDPIHVYKYGEWVSNNEYFLTNLRALIADVGPEASLNYLNTSEEEQQIIRDNFKVFLFNVDLPTRAQMVRHRVSWQELSRRYVSGKKQPFNFYISDKMQNVLITDSVSTDVNGDILMLSTSDLISMCVQHYNQAIESGIKPEEARRILPQAMMTTLWGAFQPKQLDNFFQLRLDKHAQSEIRQVAQAMKELI